MAYEDGTLDEVEWNLAGQLLIEIAYLLKAASYHYVHHNYSKWFDNLSAARMRIVDSLTKDELSEFEKMEKEITGLYALSKPKSGFKKPSEENNEKRVQFLSKVNEYNTTLFRIMKKYGYLIQKKKDKTKLNL